MAVMLSIKVHGEGLLDYSKAGKDAVQEIRVGMRKVLNVGRTEARHRIASEFAVHTGALKHAAGHIQTHTSVTAAEVKGTVRPIPRLMNIFEHGATLAHGRGILRPRPVVEPAAHAMEAVAEGIFDAVLHKVANP